MKKVIIFSLISFISINLTIACTTFVINDSVNLIYGRNFDWDIATGMIVINKRGLEKQAFVKPPGIPAKWISKYGSITFNQIGIDAPMGGMNEKGLVIAQMALFESKFPDKIEKEVVGELEWIQYQLDNSSTLAEVLENLKKVQIIPIAMPLHYMICDSLGNVGIVEYLNGELLVVQGDELTIPVCSNMIYEKSQTAIKTYDRFGGKIPLPAKWNDVSDIVAIANSMIEDYQASENAIDYGFEILKAVGSETRTQWSVVFDIKNRLINFKTINNHNIRILDFADFVFSCDMSIQTLNIQVNDKQNRLKDQFTDLTYENYFSYKRILMDTYASNMSGFPTIPDEIIKREVDYVLNIRKCE